MAVLEQDYHGAVVNLTPAQYHGIIADVPFVDDK
jgi:protease II